MHCMAHISLKGQVCGQWMVDPQTCWEPLRADAVIEISFKFIADGCISTVISKKNSKILIIFKPTDRTSQDLRLFFILRHNQKMSPNTGSINVCEIKLWFYQEFCSCQNSSVRVMCMAMNVIKKMCV